MKFYSIFFIFQFFLTSCLQEEILTNYKSIPTESNPTHQNLVNNTLETRTEYGNYLCPTDFNIEPENDWFGDGTGYFKICRNKNDKNNFIIQGKTLSSRIICIYPVDIRPGDTIVIQRDSQESHKIVNRCFSLSEDENVFTKIDNLNSQFEDFIVVEKKYEQLMNLCLLGPDENTPGNLSFCPREYPSYFSFGTVRLE